jgi:hypothetical protein
VQVLYRTFLVTATTACKPDKWERLTNPSGAKLARAPWPGYIIAFMTMDPMAIFFVVGTQDNGPFCVSVLACAEAGQPPTDSERCPIIVCAAEPIPSSSCLRFGAQLLAN